MAPHTISYWHFIVTLAVNCIISEIKRDIGRKSRVFVPPFYTTITEKERLRFSCCFSTTDTDPIHGPSGSKYVWQKVLCLFTVHARHRQTDRRTEKNDLNSGAYCVTLATKSMDDGKWQSATSVLTVLLRSLQQMSSAFRRQATSDQLTNNTRTRQQQIRGERALLGGL